ncbi:MAG: hypothetical protein NTW55_01355 [Planctomycetota bacterium]|nr:hypothetical protein [Planctomycetota bacterium]
MENPIGERRKDALRVNFGQKLKLDFHGTKVTSDTGSLAWLTEALWLKYFQNEVGKISIFSD